jgi:hypothetical protein
VLFNLLEHAAIRAGRRAKPAVICCLTPPSRFQRRGRVGEALFQTANAVTSPVVSFQARSSIENRLALGTAALIAAGAITVFFRSRWP